MSEVNFYCEHCDEAMPVIIEAMVKDELNGDIIWGDIVCKSCHLVIATVTVGEPGKYEFTKVKS